MSVRSSDWPYAEHPDDEAARGEPRWDCLHGICTCHDPATSELYEFSILLCDHSGIRMPFARYRILAQGAVLGGQRPACNEHGWLTCVVPVEVRSIVIEWAPAGMPIEPGLPYRARYHVELGQGDEGQRRRLANLGFIAQPTHAENLADFQSHYGFTNRAEAEAALYDYHDKGMLPIVTRPRVPDARSLAFAPAPDLDPSPTPAPVPQSAPPPPPQQGNTPLGGGQPPGQGTIQPQANLVQSDLLFIEFPDVAKSGAPALDDIAREGVTRAAASSAVGLTRPLTPAWGDTRLTVRLPPWGAIEAGFGLTIHPDTQGPDPRNGRTSLFSLGSWHLSVRTKGVHKAPVRWHTTPGSAQIGRVKGSQPVRLTGRARFSLWADPNFVTRKNLGKAPKNAGNIIDDISLLTTIQNDDNSAASLKPVWDVGFSGFSDAQLKKFFGDIVDRCHKEGIQALIGYSLVDRGVSRIVRFDEWLDGLSNAQDGGKQEATRYANALVDFADKHVPKADGISFDIESIGLFQNSVLKKAPPDPAKVGRLRRALMFFYHAVADRLVATNRICAITVGGLMSDDMAILSLPSLPNASTPALLAARLQTYDLPIGKPNIVLRIMAYDNAGGAGANAKNPAFNRDPAQMEWHEAVVRFALKKKGLHPHQLQLGLKNFRPRDKLPDGTFGPETGQGGTVPEKGRILRRCKEILRPNRVGLIFFTMFRPPNEKWGHNADYNEALNATPGGGPVPRPVVGQPMHIPLDADALAKLSRP